jgi:cobalt/nickel transport system permease protein
MHVPDGMLWNGVNLATGGASLCGVGIAVWRASRTLADRQVPLLGMTAAFIFAAQMINFPVAAGTSGHFLGALLAAILLGPLNALLIMALVLVAQCLFFQDGGVTALGSNIFNMGIVPILAYYAVFVPIGSLAPRSRRWFFAATAAGAWTSIVLAASACSLELHLSGTYPLAVVLPAMGGIHALIGVGEAVISVAVLGVVLAARPDLVSAFRAGVAAEPVSLASRMSTAMFVAAGLILAVGLAAFLSPFASALPDGLERVAEDHNFAGKADAPGVWKGAPAPNYALPGIGNKSVATSLAGTIGTAGVAGIVAGAGLLLRRRARRTVGSDPKANAS